MKAVTSYSPYFAWVFRLKREYCPVERNSVRCPATVLLNGRAQKLVPTDASSEAELVLLVFWAVNKPEARSTRIRGRSSLIERFSLVTSFSGLQRTRLRRPASDDDAERRLQCPHGASASC